ncbi:2-hydroxychromene-2-carboxylate isomerase [Sandarakinorhabdus sp. DWP1-3-1]|uniref:2-hydroxychromene-2-carboxylate isomerase n=1 Tax=Sandarakinorhabdus sp. DWP1-3-1 TaxID=2804627 RepID=UPI003CEA29BF
MPKTIEFLFDVGSPTSYLAHRRLPAIAARTGATVEHIPVLLGGIFKATGNAPPGMVAARGRWMGIDMARYAARENITLNHNPDFPINTITMMRMLTAARGTADFAPLLETIFAAMWQAPRNMGDPALLAAALAAGGFDPAPWLASANDPEIKGALAKATEYAVSRGAFGAPTFFVGDEFFFGQDRLDWVEAAAA